MAKRRRDQPGEDWPEDISPDAFAIFGLLRAIKMSPAQLRGNQDLLKRATESGIVSWQRPKAPPPAWLDDEFLQLLLDAVMAEGPLTIVTEWKGLGSWNAVRKLAAARGVESVLGQLASLSARHLWRSQDFVRMAGRSEVAVGVLAADRPVEELLEDLERPMLIADVLVVPDEPDILTANQVAALSRSTDASAMFLVRPSMYDNVVRSLADAAAEGRPMSVAFRQIAGTYSSDALVLTGLSQDQFRIEMPSSERDRGRRESERLGSPERAVRFRGRRAKPAPSPPPPPPPPPPPDGVHAEPPQGGDSGPAARWILAKVIDRSAGGSSVATPAFHAGAEHEIRVMIGAEQEDWLVARGRDASESIDRMLPKGTHELTVVFFIPDSETQTSTLILPPTGPSPEPAVFRFTVGKPGSVIQALISVVHRGRVLQTALLSGTAVNNPQKAPAEARITLRLQVVVPGLAELDHRQTFDAAIVAATVPGTGSVAAGVVDGAKDTVYFKKPGIIAAAKRVRELLEDAVANPNVKPKLTSEAGRRLLWDLAQQGRLLYEEIGQRLEQELAGRDLARLQVVQADAGAFIPIEFLYWLPAPANGAPLCANWKAALKGKPCTPQHHKVDALGHLEVVCPSGFWGVCKVIERQLLKDTAAEDLDPSGFGVRAEPNAARPNLPPIKGALFAWSEILDNTVAGASADLLASLHGATGHHAAHAKTWLKWAEAIDARQPELLVLLSHTVNDALEIGPENTGDRATLAQINSRYVKKLPQDAPIVFLLGCTTAVADDALASFVGRLRDQGAALVVGTITPVLGERSAEVVKAVVAKLVEQKPKPMRFGELMRSARCDLLLKGELTALCATSFGDASWFVA